MPTARIEQVTVGGRTFRLNKPARSFDDLVDEHLDSLDIEFPWWAMLWPASLALAIYLLKGDALSGSAIELGCGLGLAGMAGSAAGLGMLLTDLQPEALELARLSARENGLSLRAKTLDWADTAESTRYGTILGADILHDPDLHAPLIALLPRLLAAGGRVLLTDPLRQVARPAIASLGEIFQIESSERTVRLHDINTRVNLYECRWPDA